ncbi:MAG: methionine--tRNA ligase [Chloroflexi bacterium]|nr:methionine--tRNA ligase [Chloroflexota bacterium]
MATFYVTTPIYYVNDVPHIGHAYTTVAADTLVRYRRLVGDDVFFLTGTDEHGVNIQRIAEQRGLTPQQHADEIADHFKRLWDLLDVAEDRFIRTTEPAHKRAALTLWDRILAAGDVYRDVYTGYYCPRCEAYYQLDELLEGECPVHRLACDLEQEENYFFRLSKYQEPLERLVRETNFVEPEIRRNEVLGVLRQGLKDFSVTRRNVRWGIPVPEAPGEVLYVWVDALSNYLTGVGFPDDPATFEKYWPADVHLVGKEIIRFHCLYWPALLMSAGLPVPRRVFAHGWLTKDGQKISKTTGNVIDPAALAHEFGSDAFRFFFLREIPFGQDGDYSRSAFVRRYNADLANDLGNLVHRTMALLVRHGGAVPTPGETEGPDRDLREIAAGLPGAVREAMDALLFHEAIGAVHALITRANRYVDETAPWELAKAGNRERLNTVLYHLAETVRLAAWHLHPFLPRATTEIYRRLGAGDLGPGEVTFGQLAPGTPVAHGPALFPKREG